MFLRGTNRSGYAYTYGGGGGNNAGTNSATSNLVTSELILSPNNQSLKVDGTTITTSSFASDSYTPYSAYTSCALFARNYGENKWSGKIAYFKLWMNGVLIRNLVPCYCKSDGVIGMFDLCTSWFFTNSGTGTFVKGSNV